MTLWDIFPCLSLDIARSMPYDSVMHETTHYPVTEARNKLSSLIIRAVKGGERIVIDLQGLPAVVLVPVASERAMMDAFLDGQAAQRLEPKDDPPCPECGRPCVPLMSRSAQRPGHDCPPAPDDAELPFGATGDVLT